MTGRTEFSTEWVAELAHADMLRALQEDVGSGDLTAGLVDPQTRSHARILAREVAVICGAPWATAVFKHLDPEVELVWHVREGHRCHADQVVLELHGNARALLTAERTALNFLQMMSAVATRPVTMCTPSVKYPAHGPASSTRARPCRVCAWRKSMRCSRGVAKITDWACMTQC